MFGRHSITNLSSQNIFILANNLIPLTSHFSPHLLFLLRLQYSLPNHSVLSIPFYTCKQFVFLLCSHIFPQT